MKNILLVCNQGMSTSFLVEKMKQAAKEQSIEVNIWAVSDAELHENWGKSRYCFIGTTGRIFKKQYRESSR